MHAIIKQRAILVEKLDKELLSGIGSTKRKIREAAINTLIAPLDQDSEIDKWIFQTLPLEFLERDEIMEAIWYIETVWNLWHTISLEVVETVINTILRKKSECILMQDDESLKILSKGINSLFRMMKNHPSYQKDERFFILMGKKEEEDKKLESAILWYNKAMEWWSIENKIEWYLLSAKTYEEIWEHNMSIMLLESGYDMFGDIRMLWVLIALLSKTGRLEEAKKRYNELRKIEQENTPPFLVYKWIIDTDSELQEFEEIIALYVTDGSFVPLEAYKILADSASVYIQKNIEKEKPRQNSSQYIFWGSIEGYIESKIRYLMLMQIDIFTLCNERYLEEYIKELKKMGMEWNPESRDALLDFFHNHSSKEVKAEMKRGDNTKLYAIKKRNANQDDEEENGEEEIEYTLFDEVSLHIARIGELFYNQKFYHLQKDSIEPIRIESAKKDGMYTISMEQESKNIINSLKDQYDYYNSFSGDIRDTYSRLIYEIDEKYGIFYRRHIQNIAMNGAITPDLYPEVLLEYPDIAFLFWVEKLLSLQFPTNDPEEIAKIVEEYSLDKCHIQNAFLLVTLLSEISSEYSIWFLMNQNEMLNEPKGISLITELIRHFDPETQKEFLQDLHETARNNYDAEDFFEHTELIFWDIRENNPKKEEEQDMLLAEGNILLLQDAEKSRAIEKFKQASDIDSVMGMLEAGDLYESIWEYDLAMEQYQKAYLHDEGMWTITKILHCTIVHWKFDTAQSYINEALSKKFNIHNYILSFFAWQGKTKLAFKQALLMLKNNTEIVDIPEGTLRILDKMFDSSGSNPRSIEEFGIAFLWSFVEMRIPTPVKKDTAMSYMRHWQYIDSLCDTWEWNNLHEKIREIFDDILPEDFFEDIEINSDASLKILDQYANNMLTAIQKTKNATQNKIIKMKSENKDASKEGKYWEKIKQLENEFCIMVHMTLQRFPDSEWYCNIWKDRIQKNKITTDLYDLPHTTNPTIQ